MSLQLKVPSQIYRRVDERSGTNITWTITEIMAADADIDRETENLLTLIHNAGRIKK